MPPIPEPADDMERYEEFRRMRTERMDEIVSLRQKMGDLVKELDRMPVNTMDIPFSNLKPWVGDTLKKKNELDKRDMELKTRYFQMQGEIREVEKEQLKLEKENRDKISTASNIFRGSFKTQRVRREKIDAALDKLLEVCGEEELRMRLEKRIAAMGAKGKALEIEEPDVPKELVQAMKENLPLAHSVKEWTIDAATTVIKETGKSLKKKRTEAGHSHSRSSSVAPDFETPSRVRFASPLRRQNPEPVTPRQLLHKQKQQVVEPHTPQRRQPVQMQQEAQEGAEPEEEEIAERTELGKLIKENADIKEQLEVAEEELKGTQLEKLALKTDILRNTVYGMKPTATQIYGYVKELLKENREEIPRRLAEFKLETPLTLASKFPQPFLKPHTDLLPYLLSLNMDLIYVNRGGVPDTVTVFVSQQLPYLAANIQAICDGSKSPMNDEQHLLLESWLYKVISTILPQGFGRTSLFMAIASFAEMSRSIEHGHLCVLLDGCKGTAAVELEELVEEYDQINKLNKFIEELEFVDPKTFVEFLGLEQVLNFVKEEDTGSSIHILKEMETSTLAVLRTGPASTKKLSLEYLWVVEDGVLKFFDSGLEFGIRDAFGCCIKLQTRPRGSKEWVDVEGDDFEEYIDHWHAPQITEAVKTFEEEREYSNEENDV